MHHYLICVLEKIHRVKSCTFVHLYQLRKFGSLVFLVILIVSLCLDSSIIFIIIHFWKNIIVEMLIVHLNCLSIHKNKLINFSHFFCYSPFWSVDTQRVYIFLLPQKKKNKQYLFYANYISSSFWFKVKTFSPF